MPAKGLKFLEIYPDVIGFPEQVAEIRRIKALADQRSAHLSATETEFAAKMEAGQIEVEAARERYANAERLLVDLCNRLAMDAGYGPLDWEGAVTQEKPLVAPRVETPARDPRADERRERTQDRAAYVLAQALQNYLRAHHVAIPEEHYLQLGQGDIDTDRGELKMEFSFVKRIVRFDDEDESNEDDPDGEI